jgi:endoglucanase
MRLQRAGHPAPTFTARSTWRGPVAALRRASLLLPILIAMVACSQGSLEPTAPADPAVSLPLFGAYTYGAVWNGMEPVRALEDRIGRRLDVVHWFMSFDHAYDRGRVDALHRSDRLPLISWEPVHHDLEAIASGAYDAYLRSWANGVRDAGGLVYLRPFPEMNGAWTPWNGDPEALRAAWRHVVGLFDEEGAHNVRWVFSPNVTDEPRTDANRMERYFPGSDVVDVLALDGYNWGDLRPWSTWTPFEDVFRSGYDRIAALGTQPIWFAELASAEVGGDKAAWVADMFDTAPVAFPRLECLVWFDERKEADWRIGSTPVVADAFREALTDGGVDGRARSTSLAPGSGLVSP